MRDLIKQEQFEIEVLDRLNSGRFLNHLIFLGGTMLRLCYGLNRFSVDLDFWIIKKIDTDKLFEDMRSYLSSFYTIKDAADKLRTILFEIKSRPFPRSLKIEIRKEERRVKTEMRIAYSRYSDIQVFLRCLSPEEMMKVKVEALLKRGEIRDAFDIEFLLMKGIKLDFPEDTLKELLKKVESFSRRDYSVKLGSILEEDQRSYYLSENFKILKEKIKNLLTMRETL